MTGVVITSILCVACAFLLWHLADKRGANTKFWAIMGAVFGPIAIPFIFLTPNKPPQSTCTKGKETYKSN